MQFRHKFHERDFSQNIMFVFAWLGMIDFLVPILIAVFGGDKWFCNNLCGRGQLLTVLGEKKKLSRNRPAPRTWCSFCPMGTMTQLICRLKHR